MALKMEKIQIEINGEEKISTLLFKVAEHERAKATIIICHGFRGTKENSGNLFEFAYRLNELALNVLAFDFRGCGESDGDFADITLSRNVEDLKRLIDYADQEFSIPIILLGRSFGGSTIIAGGAEDSRVEALVLWATPVLMQETFEAMIGKSLKELKEKGSVKIKDSDGKFLLKDNIIKDFKLHDFNDYFKKLDEKAVLIIHGKQDETVDIKNANIIDENCKNSKLFLIEGADHRFTGKIKIRENISLNWLKGDILADYF